MLEVEGHLEAFHTVDTTKLDFNKPLASQLANMATTHVLSSSCDPQKNFSCACGTDFQFQDDLQVHQVMRDVYV